MDLQRGYVCENKRNTFKTQEICISAQVQRQKRTEARAKWIKGRSMCVPGR